MQIKNLSIGKVGECWVGPTFQLNENIKLGEVAICIARDQEVKDPCIWIIGGIEQVIDYLSKAENQLNKDDISVFLNTLNNARVQLPMTPIERLSRLVGCTSEELKGFAELAQVSISAPITGINDYSTGKGIPVSKSFARLY